MGEFSFMADWDLEAVVRGSCGPAAAAVDLLPFPTCPMELELEFPVSGLCLEEEAQMFDADLDGLLEGLYKPFCHQSNTTPTGDHEPSLKLSEAAGPNVSASSSSSSSSASSAEHISGGHNNSVAKLRKRKNQQKRVVEHVREEGISSDKWAWRKYGQKPIKGSPFPRSYYRCSSLKGCPARKQVERSTSDPEIFIITYTADHTHAYPTRRNSLAGTTRIKAPSNISIMFNPNNNNNNNDQRAYTSIKDEEQYPDRTLSMASIEEEEEEDLEDSVAVKVEEDEGGIFQDAYRTRNDDFLGSIDLYPGSMGDSDGMFWNRW